MNNYGVTLKFGNHFQTTNVLALKLKQPKIIAQNLEIVQGQQYLLLAAHLALDWVLDLKYVTLFQSVFLDKKQKFTGAPFSLGESGKFVFHSRNIAVCFISSVRPTTKCNVTTRNPICNTTSTII
jgi:hypothetical protein